MIGPPMGTIARNEDRLSEFEGLVITTARMYARMVHRDEEDLAQELRIKVWKALPKYDASRSALSLERYVFGVITNRIKDFKRDAAREVARRERNGIAFTHIETYVANNDEKCVEALLSTTDHATVYGHIDEGKFVLPATLTDREVRVLLLLMMGWSKAEAALRLGLGSRQEVGPIVGQLRVKLADWNPGHGDHVRSNVSQVVSLAVAVAA